MIKGTICSSHIYGPISVKTQLNLRLLFLFFFFLLGTAREQKSQKCICSTYHNQKEKQPPPPYFIIVLPGIIKLNAEFRHDVDQTTLVCIFGCCQVLVDNNTGAHFCALHLTPVGEQLPRFCRFYPNICECLYFSATVITELCGFPIQLIANNWHPRWTRVADITSTIGF